MMLYHNNIGSYKPLQLWIGHQDFGIQQITVDCCVQNAQSNAKLAKIIIMNRAIGVKSYEQNAE